MFHQTGCGGTPRLFVGLLLTCVIVIGISLFRNNSDHVRHMYRYDTLPPQRGIFSRFASTQLTDEVFHVNVGERDNSKVRMQSTIENNNAFWGRVASLSNSRCLYPVEFRAQDVLSRLATAEVKSAQCFCSEELGINFGHTNDGGPVDFGSTHKWLLHLEGRQLVIFKPMW